MSINETAFDTAACMAYKTQNIVGLITKAIVTHNLLIKTVTLSNTSQQIKVGLVQGGNIANDTIPYFNHPIMVSDPSDVDADPIVVIDVRNFGSYNKPQQKFIVRNNTEYMWSIRRAVLNHIWMHGRKETLRDLSLLPAAAYSSMIAESVGRRYALDMAQQTILQVLACYHYYCLFTDQKEFDEVEHNKIVGAIARATRVQADFIYTVLKDTPVIQTLSDFCKVAKEKTQSVSLTDFDIGILFSITGGNWFGTNSRELMAVALEHVPTWVMIVFGGVTEATYKRSVLAKLLERLDKRHSADTFAKNLIVLLTAEAEYNIIFDETSGF
jgi:hypothetical protein